MRAVIVALSGIALTSLLICSVMVHESAMATQLEQLRWAKQLEQIRCSRIRTATPVDTGAQWRLQHAATHAAIRASQMPLNCSSQTYIECRVGRYCGIGCRLHRIAACSEAALANGSVAVFVEQKGLFPYQLDGCSEWNCTFEDISNCSSWFRASRRRASSLPFSPALHSASFASTAQAAMRRLPSLRPPHEFEYSATWLRGHILAHIMRPTSRLKGRRETCRKRWPRVDAGIHVRWGDKVGHEAKRHEVREYMQHVDHFVLGDQNYHAHYGRSYNKTLFVATDDPSVVDELKSNRDYSPYTLLHSPVAEIAAASNYRAASHLETLLCEVDRLTASTYFVGTFSSQVSRLVFELKVAADEFRGGRISVASLDEGYYL